MNQLISLGIPNEHATELLEKYDGNVERAANAYFEGVQELEPEQKEALSISNELIQIIRNLNVQNVRRGSDSVPTLETRLHPDVENGDCVFFCCWKILELLGAEKVRRTKMEMATLTRGTIHAYIEQNWTNQSPSGMEWHELVALAHNTSIPDEEREEYGTWPDKSSDRLVHWQAERNQLFGGESDLLAFISFCADYNLHIFIRVWREHDTSFFCVTTCCTNDDHEHAIYADIKHSGELDTNGAHMQLMSSGAFYREPILKKRPRQNKDTAYKPKKKTK